MDCQQRFRWTLYSSFAAIFVVLSIMEIGFFSTMRKALLPSAYLRQPQNKFVIVFDGGSTGTRIHVFNFLNGTDGALSLQNEYFEEIKPGLSSYADYPPDAANSVEKLLTKAHTIIPSDHWSHTPIALKATAGLRLLPIHVSEAILMEVHELCSNSPFHCEGECVDVLDGEDEGLFAWFTINFLLGYLEDPKESAALLDLGGGSTQVTFAPSDLNSIVFSPNGFIISRNIHSKTVTIYSHSYLGLGLMSARMAILKISMKNSDENAIVDTSVFQSACIAPSTNTKWKHGLETYTVRGLESGEYGFDECYEKAVEFLNVTVHSPVELSRQDVYGISYYFDRAADLGIIDRNGGIVTVNEFIEASRNECTKTMPERPFLCLDGTYISALLHHGLGLSKHKQIRLVHQINGIETSWGLGAAFSLLKS